jgi:hypothetical protein
MRSDLVDIICEEVHRTGSAILVKSPVNDEKVWIPLSCCEVTQKTSSTIELTMREPMAIEKELI